MHTLKSALRVGITRLEPLSPTPQIDTKILLESVLGVDELVLSSPEKQLTEDQIVLFSSYLTRRKNGEPIAYILGKKEFFGLEFYVSPSVLIPRPDSEILVENTLNFLQENDTVMDLCTGSGCIVISILKTKVNVKAIGVDISEKALKIAKKNAKNLIPNANLEFKQEDVLSLNFKINSDIVVSNPPYILSQDIAFLDRSVKNYEPHLALDGGKDGLHFYRIIAEKSQKSRVVLVEIGQGMEDKITQIFCSKNYKPLLQAKDLSGIIRVLAFKPLFAKS